MQPLFVVTGGFFIFKEKIPKRALMGGAAALSGSVIIGLGDFQAGGQGLWGDILAFIGAFMISLYILIGRSLRSRLSLFPYVFVVYGTSALFLLLINLAGHTPLYPYPGLDWILFFALAIVPTIFGHTVFNWVLRYVKAAVVSVSILGEPVGATLMAYIVFKESPGLMQIIGGLAIIAGLYIFISSSHGK
jgi:drug/metabolite transporter (DMT)-like permease